MWQWIPSIVAGKTYTFTGYVDIPSSSVINNFNIEVSWWGDGGTALISTDSVNTYNTSTNGVWDYVITNVTAPPGTQSATVRMIITGLQGQIYIDDFSFQPQ